MELTAPIPMGVISPFSNFNSAISNTNAQHSRPSRTSRSVAAENDRSIGNRIGSWNCRHATCFAEVEAPTNARRYHLAGPSDGNPRVMLQIGAILGLAYFAFLAVWIWATRFRIRPPRSAST